MCLPFVVRADTALPEQAQRQPLYRETALMPSAVNVLHTQAVPQRITWNERAAKFEMSLPCPVTDANGLPVMRMSYIRSNYQAFCLTGSGG